ncbi:MAG: hypothetical protein RL701_5514 [Pseudomonadota bacterium]|jgi:Mg-chelatase subunit ChlD
MFKEALDAHTADSLELSLLASAVAGVQIRVSLARSGKLSALSAHDTITLSAALPNALRPEVCTAHALLVTARSMHTQGLMRLIGRPAAARRFFALELQRTLSAHGTRLPHNIEAALRQRQHGAERPASDASEALHWALDSTRRVHTLPTEFGTVRPARLAWAGGAARTHGDAGRSTNSERHGADDELDPDAGSDRMLRALSSPLGGNAIGNLFLKLLGFGRAGAAQSSLEKGGASDDASASDQAHVAQQTSEIVSAATSLRELRLPAAEPRGFCYPEWNVRTQSYRAQWVSVLEFPPDTSVAGASPEPVKLQRRLLRTQLSRIGVEFERQRGQLDGEELDLDRVVRFASEQHAGAPAHIYTSTRRTKRDLTLLVLMDISQSTAERNAHGMSIFGQQRALAREIVQTSHRLGDRVALYAYHSRGRHHVHCLRVKSFREPFSSRAQARLAALQPGGLSRLGAAVRHMTQLLEAETQHTHRLLLLLSDGFAYDDGYEHGYAESDTARALAEAKRQGVACLCLNIGTVQDDETLKRIYGDAAYLRCADAERAVPALRKLVRSALARC